MKSTNQIFIFAIFTSMSILLFFSGDTFFSLFSGRYEYLLRMYSLSACIHFILSFFVYKEVDNVENSCDGVIAIFLSIPFIIGVYFQINGLIESYTPEMNIYIFILLIPAIMLFSEKTNKFFLIAYVFAMAVTFYFYIYKHNHDYEIIFKDKAGITCSRGDEPEYSEDYGAEKVYVRVNEGDAIETLDNKIEFSSENISTFCIYAEAHSWPYTYYFLLNNNIYKYIHKEHTEHSN